MLYLSFVYITYSVSTLSLQKWCQVKRPMHQLTNVSRFHRPPMRKKASLGHPKEKCKIWMSKNGIRWHFRSDSGQNVLFHLFSHRILCPTTQRVLYQRKNILQTLLLKLWQELLRLAWILLISNWVMVCFKYPQIMKCRLEVIILAIFLKIWISLFGSILPWYKIYVANAIHLLKPFWCFPSYHFEADTYVVFLKKN